MKNSIKMAYLAADDLQVKFDSIVDSLRDAGIDEKILAAFDCDLYLIKSVLEDAVKC